MKKKTNTTHNEALIHYGGLEKLTNRITERVKFHIAIGPIYDLMNRGGMHPNQITDVFDPAYVSDAVAERCLSSFERDEDDICAIDNSLTYQIHHDITLMEQADLTAVHMDDNSWEQYALHSLLRLVWRTRDKRATISFYLTKESDTQLHDKFIVENADGITVLLECSHGRVYEIEHDEFDNYADFESACRQNFMLATEDYGYFATQYVWLCRNAIDIKI